MFVSLKGLVSIILSRKNCCFYQIKSPSQTVYWNLRSAKTIENLKNVNICNTVEEGEKPGRKLQPNSYST